MKVARCTMPSLTALLLLTASLFERYDCFTVSCDVVKCAEVNDANCTYGIGKNGCCYECARGPGETCVSNVKECGTGMICRTGYYNPLMPKAGVCIYMDVLEIN
ncbi:uncharacterized protein LOC135370985 [Ornithodoros turicata]|uniref:uncharacterized protein LOC135370985 n=1 Tax=Ornithodoros turicata TaxID=34597 RepID=UPI00313A2D0E